MPDLIVTQERGVAVLTLNRPESRNALTTEMVESLSAALGAIAEDDKIGCVLLTGAGGAFCSGGDVKGMAEAGGGAGLADTSTFERAVASLRKAMECSRQLHLMPKPTIAALPGAAAGAGLSLALACDLRIAAAGAKLTTAFVKVGLSGDFGGSYFLSRLVGAGKAKELYFLGEVILAEEAERLGIVTRVTPAADLAADAMALAQRLADGPRVALRYMKQNLNLAGGGCLDRILDQEAFLHARTAATADHAQAVGAFVQRREPRFVGS